MTPTAFDNARKCARCGWEWVRRGEQEPKRCPRCRSEYWNQVEVAAEVETLQAALKAKK